MPRRYVPERGDVIWLEFDPQAGHEQAGRRPALVVSPAAYNGRVGLALLCPITSRVKSYPFEVLFPPEARVDGAVLADQVKSLDWRARRAKRFAVASRPVMDEVLGKIQALLAT